MNYSLDHEMALLGIIIKCNDLEIIFDIVSKLKIDAFYEPKHQLIYKGILNLLKAKTLPDIVNLPEAMRDTLINAGGMEYLLELIDGVSSISNYRHYVEKVKELWVKREFIKYARALENKIEPTSNNEEIFDFSMGKLKEIYNLTVDDKIESVARTYNKIASKKIVKIFNTGYKFIDKSHTVEPGRFFLLAGKEKIGKTTFALNLIANVLNQSKSVLFYSLEMQQRAIMDRIVSVILNNSGIDRTINEVERTRKESYQVLAPFENFYIRDQRGGVNIEKIEREALQVKPDLIVIDNSKLIHSDFRKQGLEAHFNHIATSLFTLAGELKCCVLLIAHLNRAKIGKEDSKNDTLYGGGSLQQACDLAIFLQKDDAYDGNVINLKAEITANRYGPYCDATLICDRAKSIMKES